MRKVLIIGATGMLGRMVYREFKPDWNVIVVYRSREKLRILSELEGKPEHGISIQADFARMEEEYRNGFTTSGFPPSFTKFIEDAGSADRVINCAGIIPQHGRYSEGMMWFLNTAFPHLLGMVYGDRLIHISTDCVFSGTGDAPYSETSEPHPNSLYGLTKFLGEPKDGSLVFRTSFIGPELTGCDSLYSWFIHADTVVNGYTGHLWNGMTTLQMARCLRDISDNTNGYPMKGLFHLFSTDISKYDLLCLLRDGVGKRITIRRVSGGKVDRRLRSNHDFVRKLAIPPISDQIAALTG